MLHFYQQKKNFISQCEISLKTMIFVSVMTMKLRLWKRKENVIFC